MKLGQFSFKLVYEKGSTNPCDYGSRHPAKQHEDEEDDTEIFINRVVEELLPAAVTRKMMRKSTDADSQLQMLKADIKEGKCRNSLHRYAQVFGELAVVDGLVVRGEQLVIPKELWTHVIQVAHEGHMGQDKTLGLLRQTAWFPGMGPMVKEFVETCRPCMASTARKEMEPLKPTELPAGPWRELNADFKGPIGGNWYFHVLIDQYTKFPVVSVVKSTGWETLRPVLEDALATHGIPEIITTDGGPPYNGEEFKKFAQNMGFTHRLTTPESAQANGFAEIFVKTLVKLIHTAVADKKDPQRAVQSYLMAYRATPHTVTGRSPAELLFNRSIQTKLPRALREEQATGDKELRERHNREKEKQKKHFDKRNKTKEKQLEVGDEIMLQQKKTTLRSPFDPDTYKVKEVKGSSVVAERRGRKLTRAKNLIKKVKQRPEYLKEAGKEKTKKIIEEDIEVDMDRIRKRVAETEGERMEGAEERGEERIGEELTGEEQAGEVLENNSDSDSDDSRFTVTYDDQEEENRGESVSHQTTGSGRVVESVNHQTTRSGRVVIPPLRFGSDTVTKSPSLSPRERRRRQSMRKKEKQTGKGD